ncbi:response regulator [Paenibacillus sp. y28]|uniref:response regulator n=1 Tax=Paenibacillus sp. y28 TaxID=3129110 RepID=UPI00301688E6
MKALLVDDEHLALQQLKHMLEQEIGGVQVVGMFSDPTKVHEAVRQLQPDVVFLDIHMPGIQGLQLGELLQASYPAVEVVFVTGYDQYALQAFELYALDYIMKPVQLDRLQKTLQRLTDKMGAPAAADQNTEAAIICCFKHLRYKMPGEEPQPLKWRTSKARELFAFLLHNRNRTMDREVLIELLWPSFDVMRAAQQLYTAIYHIRQTLKGCGLDMISITSGDLEVGYRLTLHEVRIDTDEWEEQVKQLERISWECAADHERVMNMYEGDYYGEYEYLWAEHERERLRLLWLHHAQNLSGFYMEQGSLQAAVSINHSIQQQLPYEETSYFTLMKLYHELGRPELVEEQYTLLLSRLEGELESAVDTEITDWYEDWKQVYF